MIEVIRMFRTTISICLEAESIWTAQPVAGIARNYRYRPVARRRQLLAYTAAFVRQVGGHKRQSRRTESVVDRVANLRFAPSLAPDIRGTGSNRNSRTGARHFENWRWKAAQSLVAKLPLVGMRRRPRVRRQTLALAQMAASGLSVRGRRVRNPEATNV